MTNEKSGCNDPHCGIHGGLLTRGRQFVGTVTDAKAQKTATIEWSRKHFIPKFERYEIRRSRVKVHNPDCVSAKKGDKVIIGETRPISKTKAFVILKQVGRDIDYLQREEALDRVDLSKRKKTEEEEK